MARTADIALNDDEKALLSQIAFASRDQNTLQASMTAMAALAELLLSRKAIPEVRLRYFTDPDCNPGGRGKSRADVFRANGKTGREILSHPHFFKYLEYFICGPRLPSQIIHQFKEAAKLSDHLSSSDLRELTPDARNSVRTLGLDPHEAAEEFHKLALECGADPFSADAMRRTIKALKVRARR